MFRGDVAICARVKDEEDGPHLRNGGATGSECNGADSVDQGVQVGRIGPPVDRCVGGTT